MKTHLNLRASDLNKSVAFYELLLDSKPAKHYADYALFLTEEPGLELALDRDPEMHLGESAHYGIVVETPQDVDAAILRLQGAGLNLDIEIEETCCYAKQSKAWATDPDGRRWEVYTVLEETQERDNEETACCVSTQKTDAACCPA
ncbi:MAG: ArsI/CadI family heavy metal resistance metalloenzyme [Candidatus Baltobacteraceae bacterium]